ncbi:MAG: DUF1302 domain-containing protein [Limnobacter sp.]|nr:DUF1302 domain-containing protein [Limnobacter sp.]
MNTQQHKATRVAAELATGLILLGSTSVYAVELRIGDMDLTINSTVSVGQSIRMENRDRALYSPGNSSRDGTKGTGKSNTGDDGNLNFDKGDAFSTIVKGIHELELKRDNYGAFTRVKWFYDSTLNNSGVYHGHEPTSNARDRHLNDSGAAPYAKFDGINLLEAYGYWNTQLMGKESSIRLGRQVIGWGESFFIQSPISGLNPIDVSALRRPGAELKEAFTPSEMLYANISTTESTSLEAFYQLKWRNSVPELCGTYFSSSDVGADGCNRLAFAASAADQNNYPAGFVINRGPDQDPKNGGQFGLAFRKYASSLGAEFGAYYMNYHNRLPLFSLKKASDGSTFARGVTTAGAPVQNASYDGQYVVDFPENISIIGGSFSTNYKGWAWAGEVSRAMDVPIQISTVELLRAGIFGQSIPVFNGSNQVSTIDNQANRPGTGSTFSSRYAAAPNGSIVKGYDRFNVTQIQSSFIRQFDRILGASAYSLAGEVGAVFVSGLPDTRTQRYGRSSVFGGGADAGNTFNAGFVTDFSWGYRLRLAGNYRDVYKGIAMLPSIAFSHDVEGWSPEPGQSFNEGRQTLGLGVTFEFDSATKAAVNYTKYINAADYDVLRDRDFLALTASKAF